MDVYYKIKALHELGVQITLHCFEYGRREHEALNEICSKVYYYQRKQSLRDFSRLTPYIVATRKSDELLKNLCLDEAPILFEGLHTCYHLSNKELQQRLKVVRLHNVEWDYYRNLGKIERGMFRKFYFYTESFKLKNYEKILEHARFILPIAKSDVSYIREKFEQTSYLPAFHPNERVTSLPGKGYYALYHGNLSVGENNQAALYLVNKIFNDLEMPLIIAGGGPSDMLVDAVRQNPRIELIINPREEEMSELVKHAQMNILPTFQSTGIKLKLINSLYNGRWVIVNRPMIEHSSLEEVCVVADSAAAMKAAVMEYADLAYTKEESERRSLTLSGEFSNRKNAQMLARWLFGPDSTHPAQ